MTAATQDCAVQADAERLAATTVLAASGVPPSVISFHGTGTTASRSGIRYLLDHLAHHGISSACFDFSGHGDSTGSAERASLRVRQAEARTAVAELIGDRLRAIVGTSMGGHIAAVLSAILRPRTLVLVCPAAYPDDAIDRKLDASFASIARRATVHRDSPAYRALATFEGNMLVIAGTADTVVGADTIDAYASSARCARSVEVIWLAGCDHLIHRWLQHHDDQRAAVLREVVKAISDGSVNAAPPCEKRAQ